MSIELIIHGAAGRMGQRLVALSQENDAFKLVMAVEYDGSPALGRDAGEVAMIPATGVKIQHELDLKPGQVVIDFSLPSSLDRLLSAVHSARAALVCGTTGFSEAHLAQLREASQDIAIVHSPNMSVGVNLLFLAARQMTQWVGDDFDIEILELHHHFKRDAPSGTALGLAKHIAEAREKDLSEILRTDRTGDHPPRPAGEIGMQAVRGGDIVGEHTVFYCGMGERIELTHRATSRDIFARGALRAARWIHQKPAGLYSMFDVLSFQS